MRKRSGENVRGGGIAGLVPGISERREREMRSVDSVESEKGEWKSDGDSSSSDSEGEREKDL